MPFWRRCTTQDLYTHVVYPHLGVKHLGSAYYFHLVLCTDVLVLSMYFKYFENKVVFLFVTTVHVQCTQEHSIDIRCLASLNVEHLRCIKPADDL